MQVGVQPIIFTQTNTLVHTSIPWKPHFQDQSMGYSDTSCLKLDGDKVVSGDGQVVRVWSHLTGRRIATLKGHTGPVSCVAFDDNFVVSGCGQGSVRVWGMDDLKCCRVFRSAHEGGRVSAVGLLNGIPISAGTDGTVRLWDVSAGQPIMSFDAPRGQPILGLEVQQVMGGSLCWVLGPGS